MNGTYPWLGSGNTQLSLAKTASVLNLRWPQETVPPAQSIAQFGLQTLRAGGAELHGVVHGLNPCTAQSIAQTGPLCDHASASRRGQVGQRLQAAPAQLIAQKHHRLSPAVLAYLQAALSENTKRAYQQDLRDFVAWGGRVPCNALTLSTYLAESAESLSVHSKRAAIPS
jgi:hypothetical protein